MPLLLEDTTVACDIDDIVVDIASPWIQRLSNSISPIFSSFNPFRRNKWQILDELEDLGYIRQPQKELIFSYYCKEDFYDDLKPTQFGFVIKTLIESNSINLKFITSCSSKTELSDKSKLKWIQTYYPSTEVIWVDGIKKSEAINSIGFEPNIFIDDNLEHIIDVGRNVKGIKGLLTPDFLHNKFSPQLELEMRLKGIELFRYKP